ncbi:MAG: hypothetical protein ACP5RM_02105 [Candidatus Micrarchaeia archaeon]
MIKKLVYIGIVLVILAFGIFYLSGSLTKSVLSKNMELSNLTIANDSYIAIPVSVRSNQSSAFTAVTFESNSSINAYMLNSSDYAEWINETKSNMSKGGLYYAKALDYKNNTALYLNKTVVSTILSSNSSGINYLVLDNTLGSASSGHKVLVELVVMPLRSSSLLPFAGMDIGAIIIIIAGIIVIAYGIFKKGQPLVSAAVANAPQQKNDAYIDELYKSIEKSKKHSKRKKTSD